MQVLKAAYLGVSPFNTQDELALILMESKEDSTNKIEDTARTKEKC